MIDNYSDLPLGLYQRILALNDAEEDADLTIVSLLSGLSEDSLLTMPLSEYTKLRDGASFLFFQPLPAVPKPVYHIGGFDLVCTQMRDLTTAQYIDFKEWGKVEGDSTAEWLSVLLVPKGKKYNDGYDIAEVLEAIKTELSVTEASGLLNFFQWGLVTLTRGILTSSDARKMMREFPKEQRKKMKKMARELRALSRSGAGYSRWIMSTNLRAGLSVKYMR